MKKIKANPVALKALGTRPFDPAAYLDDDETIIEYLSAAMQDTDADMLLEAIRTVARARGMSQLARDSGLGRESLYKALASGAKPRYETVTKIMRALGLRLQVGAAV